MRCHTSGLPRRTVPWPSASQMHISADFHMKKNSTSFKLSLVFELNFLSVHSMAIVLLDFIGDIEICLRGKKTNLLHSFPFFVAKFCVYPSTSSSNVHKMCKWCVTRQNPKYFEYYQKRKDLYKKDNYVVLSMEKHQPDILTVYQWKLLNVPISLIKYTSYNK